jgi:hypothetical protein
MQRNATVCVTIPRGFLERIYELRNCGRSNRWTVPRVLWSGDVFVPCLFLAYESSLISDAGCVVLSKGRMNDELEGMKKDTVVA